MMNQQLKTNTAMKSRLEVDGIRTVFKTETGTVPAVNRVSFDIAPGETFGLVGESGAGKSVTTRTIMRLIDSPGEIVDGEIRYEGQDLLSLSENEMKSVRGNDIALIPQDPMTALNPVLSVREQIAETIVEHQNLSSSKAAQKAVEIMTDVGIPDAETRVDDYPHEFSGGMRQRVLIAIALSCEPDVLIADEPTTALDVTTEAKILDLLNEIQSERELAILLITHDLGVVAQTCDRVGVMYAGNLVEKAAVETLFETPRHPYTKALLDSIPDVDGDYERLYALDGSMPDLTDLEEGCNFAPRCAFATDECRSGGDPPLNSLDDTDHHVACSRVDEIIDDLAEDTHSHAKSSITKQSPDPNLSESGSIGDPRPLLSVRNLKKHFSHSNGLLNGIHIDSWDGFVPKLSRESVKAVDGVSFELDRGETLGVVGESGCGKSTIAQTVLRLYKVTDGVISLDNEPLHEMNKRSIRSLRSEMQIVFQDPQSSLNPRKTVGQILGRAMEKHDIETGDAKRQRAIELLERVGLSAADVDKYPHEFSGGQQQRIAISHALAVEPKLIICDEPVSALDVSVQAQILNLLDDLQEEYNIAYLFISHDISVVRHICDRVLVMYLGKIVESGPVEQIFSPPFHPYTESLLSAVPRPVPSENGDRILLEGTVPSPVDPPSGCSFHTRCHKRINGTCSKEVPNLETKDPQQPDHKISCHLSTEEMSDAVFDTRDYSE